ncbi:MAG: RHS repeat domain-containing protein, partial [Dietzia sp.]|nr:RHS repeat domain-containing protein [Dietzia sp.]
MAIRNWGSRLTGTAEFTCADLVQDALNPVGTADTTQATYTQGLLTQITDPRGVPRSYRYDLRGLMVAEIDEAGAVDSAKYDPAGLLTTHRTRLVADTLTLQHVEVTNSYDVMDRVTKTVIPGRTMSIFSGPRDSVSGDVPADSVRVSYDSLGNVLSMTNRNAVITRSYYETGHIRSERVVPVAGTALADSTGYAYDSAGRLRRVMWQSGDSVVYRYTVAGDLDTMRVYWRTSTTPRSESWRFTWDGLGRRRIIHYPFNQMTVQYSYDRLGTLRRVLSSNP